MMERQALDPVAFWLMKDRSESMEENWSVFHINKECIGRQFDGYTVNPDNRVFVQKRVDRLSQFRQVDDRLTHFKIIEGMPNSTHRFQERYIISR
jgi:hypothetical protein